MYSGYYYDSGHHWGYDDVLWYLDGAVGSFILVLSLVIGSSTARPASAAGPPSSPFTLSMSSTR